MALFSEQERIDPRSVQVRYARLEPPLHEVLVLVTLKAKRQRVLEVKLRRIAAELEAVTGSPPTAIQVVGGGSAVFGTQSWVAPNILIDLLQARLEQECPNGGMFHFSAQGDGSDSVVAVEANRAARM